MANISENQEITVLQKKAKTKFSLLLFLGLSAVPFIFGAVALFQAEDLIPIGAIFMLLGIVAGIICIALFNSYRNLKQQISKKTENDPDAAEAYEKNNVFEKKKNLRQYPFMLILAILALAYLYFSDSDTPVWYYAILLILFLVGIIRYFVEKKKIDKQLQEKDWGNEEKEHYAATQEHNKKTILNWAKGIAIVLAMIGLMYFLSSIITPSSSKSHKCTICGTETRYTYRNGRWFCGSCSRGLD